MGRPKQPPQPPDPRKRGQTSHHRNQLVNLQYKYPVAVIIVIRRMTASQTRMMILSMEISIMVAMVVVTVAIGEATGLTDVLFGNWGRKEKNFSDSKSFL